MTKRAPVQIDFNSVAIGKIRYACIPWVDHQEIFDKHYAPRFGTSQSAKHLAERGGFGVKEAAYLGYNPLVFWFSGEENCPKIDEEWKKCAIRFNDDDTYNYYVLSEEEYRGLDIFDKVMDNYNI
jgi:hypothetical protein